MRRSLLIIPVALLLLLVPCGSAVAAFVSLDDETGNLVYRAARGERNDLRIRATGDEPVHGHDFVSFFFVDSVPIDAGGECRPAGGGPSTYFAKCELDWAGGRVVVGLGDRDDRARFSGSFAVPAVMTGGRGDDRLRGNEGRNWLAGGRGRDVISGRGGSDTIFAVRNGVDSDLSADRLYGGAGNDEIFGSAGDNLIVGGPAADVIYAQRGRDRVGVRDGAVDQVICGRGSDATANDPYDFLIRCESTEPVSDSPAVPVWLHAYEDSTGGTTADVLVGCLERHPASACSGSIQLEQAGRPVAPETGFTSASGHRQLVTVHPDPGVESVELQLAVRIRSRASSGAPTDDVFPATSLLLGFPFLN
jgi:Ca2+-binding RTX toxin-like protein